MSRFMLAITALALSVSGAVAAQTMSAPAGAETAEVGAVEIDRPAHHQVRDLMLAPHRTTLIIPGGTEIPVTLAENVTIKRDEVGHIFAAHISRNVTIDGRIAIVSGAPAELTLTENQESGSASFRLVRISIEGDMRSVLTDVGRADANQHGLNTGQKTGIGAAAGGLIGLLTGGGSGLLKGAAVGAGGGLAWGLLDKGSRQVEQGSSMVFTLVQPIRVR